MRKSAMLAALFFSPPAFAQTLEPPLEQISLGASFVMLGFLLIAAFIALSFLCKLLVVFDLLPKKGKFRDAVYWIAKAASGTRLIAGRDSGQRGGSKGSGGSFGGDGSSGNW